LREARIFLQISNDSSPVVGITWSTIPKSCCSHFASLAALGKPFDYMVFPNRDHVLREGDGTVVHVRMHILRYLVDNLPAGPR
jgi:hypothetical protein